jgi:cysteine desulfurase
LNQLEKLLSDQKGNTLVSLMHGNNEIGTMTNIHRVGEICKKYHVLFHCDAVQTIGKYHMDIQQDNISFLTASAHKFHGPKGSGFVFISNQNMLQPYIHGGAQERNMRAGTENVAGIVGMAHALEVSIKKYGLKLQ